MLAETQVPVSICHSWRCTHRRPVSESRYVSLVIFTISSRSGDDSSLRHMLSCCCLVAQSCLTLCDSMDCSPLGSSVHGILQIRILEWTVISFSRGSSPPRGQTHVSCIAGRFFTNEPLGKLHVVLSDYKAKPYNQFS